MRFHLVIAAAILALLFPATGFPAEYVIGDGDVLEVGVWGVRDLSFSARVRPDGRITVPGLGEVTATGKTPSKLQDELRSGLRSLVKNPIVTVSVLEITNNQIHIFGGGVTSGVYDLNRRTTLLQLLCQISDFSNADLSKAYVLRNQETIKKDFADLFFKGDAAQDLVLTSGDIIFIPEAAEKNVYVLGAVLTPRFVVYREGLTVMEAILEAGGFNRFARPNNTVILRKVEGKEKTIPIRMDDLIKRGDLTQNVRLNVGDYIIVKESLF